MFGRKQRRSPPIVRLQTYKRHCACAHIRARALWCPLILSSQSATCWNRCQDVFTMERFWDIRIKITRLTCSEGNLTHVSSVRKQEVLTCHVKRAQTCDSCRLRFLTHMAQPSEQYTSLNCPEENDETRSQEFESECLHSMTLQRTTEKQQIIHQHDTVSSNHIPHHLSATYAHQTPFPSWDQALRANPSDWQYSSNYSLGQRASSPHSLPSCLPSAVYQTISDGSLFYPSRPHSLPGSCNPSLEHPGSLHSFIPSAQNYPHPSCSYPTLHPPCCGPFGQPQPHIVPVHHCSSRPGHHLPHRPSGPARQMDPLFSEHDASPKPKQAGPVTHLSQEQRKVFVTYEADSEEHLKEIIKFVALLRNNGFDTHIDVFEQQLSSISKIDCMERYLNEKDYLIIIIISLRYYETVTGNNINERNHERTSDTVYIHKQLQSEFIQNGCRNYRFIPILFPGANKSCVPTWLQNTRIFSWPRDHDDILRRLMRLEKYNPPPIGPLPTIVSIPL